MDNKNTEFGVEPTINDNLAADLVSHGSSRAIERTLCEPKEVERKSSACSASIRAFSRKNRIYVFREFLWKTYASQAEYLQKDDLILDVAGGKGDLSWLLINVHSIKSVVVDPRALSSTSQLVKSVRWLEEHPEEARERAIPHRSTYQPLAALVPEVLHQKEERQKQTPFSEEFLEPRQLQIKVDHELVEALRNAKREQAFSNDCPESWKKFWTRQLQADTTAQMPAGTCFLPESERVKTTKPPIQDACVAWNVFQSIRLIAGFHPDQATEACVDLAELLGVPVCIVPCCVFPSEFPDRRVTVEQRSAEGAYSTEEVRVRDYQTFLPYLKQKQPKLREATLSFHQTDTSRNIVLYSLPEDASK